MALGIWDELLGRADMEASIDAVGLSQAKMSRAPLPLGSVSRLEASGSNAGLEAPKYSPLGPRHRDPSSEPMPVIPNSWLASLGQVTPEQADALDFGVIRLDDAGIVTLYNAWESRLAGVQPEAALGRSFFREVAPCTGNALFEGRFREGLRAGELDESFRYVFSFRMDPVTVMVRMVRHRETGTNWILVTREPKAPDAPPTPPPDR